jgi:hypothetical protein
MVPSEYNNTLKDNNDYSNSEKPGVLLPIATGTTK